MTNFGPLSDNSVTTEKTHQPRCKKVFAEHFLNTFDTLWSTYGPLFCTTFGQLVAQCWTTWWPLGKPRIPDAQKSFCDNLVTTFVATFLATWWLILDNLWTTRPLEQMGPRPVVTSLRVTLHYITLEYITLLRGVRVPVQVPVHPQPGPARKEYWLEYFRHVVVHLWTTFLYNFWTTCGPVLDNLVATRKTQNPRCPKVFLWQLGDHFCGNFFGHLVTDFGQPLDHSAPRADGPPPSGHIT